MKLKIKIDSRLVEKGDTFVAIKGYTVDGHDFIDQAIARGASKVVCEHGTYPVETILVEDSEQYLIDYLSEHYASYLRQLKIIGITGTNGKTTSASLLHNALNKLGRKTAYIGTIGFYIEKKIKELPNTTPGILELYQLLLQAYEENCEYVVMEVSSQGLANRRVEGFLFDYAIFTNLSQDHLDFHKTMGNYALAKQMLFQKLKPTGKAIVNYDDSYKEYYLLKDNTNITYGLNGGDYIASNVHMTHRGTQFELRAEGIVTTIDTPLIGNYNIYNLLVVIVVLHDLAVSFEEIKKLALTLRAPDGRMDTVAYGTNSIIIDYAHTPDAIRKIIDTMRSVTRGNIYVVFGCTGDRDRLKRPIMAKVVTDMTTYSIMTIDDPHNEDPNQIIHDMLSGLENSNYEVILDRRKAIRRGIDLLKEDDILLILGKGHESVILFKEKKIPFNDKEEVKKYLQEKETQQA